MKAIVLSHYGSPEQLALRDIEKPMPKDGEVLVNVHATTINDWDWCLVRGTPFYIRVLCGWRKPNISVPGAEIAGRIEAVGQNVTQFQVGDAVYGDISECGFGGFADYVCVPETALTTVPDGITFAQAAAIPHAAMLALQGLRDAGHLQPGQQPGQKLLSQKLLSQKLLSQKLLINGAGGGVGSLGVQIAHALGVKDVTGVDHASKFALMRSLGFTHTLDYTHTDFTTGKERYDIILDTKTNRSPFTYLPVLKPGGTYVTVGGLTPRLLQVALLGPMIHRLTQKRVHVVNLQPNKDLDYINELLVAGQLKPAIEGPYPLSDVPRLIQHFGEGRHLGKVVIAPKA